MSPWRQTIAADHVALHQFFAQNDDGDLFKLWWPADTSGGAHEWDQSVEIDATPAESRQPARGVIGMFDRPEDIVAFQALASAFPEAAPPESDVIFYAGHTEATRRKYVVTTARQIGGLVMLEAKLQS